MSDATGSTPDGSALTYSSANGIVLGLTNIHISYRVLYGTGLVALGIALAIVGLIILFRRDIGADLRNFSQNISTDARDVGNVGAAAVAVAP